MNFVKRAFRYCFRQKGKTMILFFILVILSTFLLTGLAIRDASEGAAADVQTAIGGKILLEPDTEGHMGLTGQSQWGETYAYNGDLITQKIVDAIRKVEGVVDYNSEDTSGYWGAGVNFQYLPASLDLSYTPYGASSGYTATLSSEQCADFESGKYNLVDGRHITPEDRHVCLISKELADYNRLSVGDNMQMYSLDSDTMTEFEIVGIFDGTEGTSGNALTVDEIPANCGYIDYATMFELFGEEQDGYGQLTIYVEDPVGVQNVYDRIAALPELKGKTLKLRIDTEEYDVVQAPLETLQSVVNTILIIIVVVSFAVLTLLLTLWIRDRKKEIGIYLSIGKSKAGIIGQFSVETVTVAMAAFAASPFLGNLIAGKVSEFLVSRVTAGAAMLDVEISAAYVWPVTLVGIAIIAVAVSLASWTVFRFKPRDILSKIS